MRKKDIETGILVFMWCTFVVESVWKATLCLLRLISVGPPYYTELLKIQIPVLNLSAQVVPNCTYIFTLNPNKMLTSKFSDMFQKQAEPIQGPLFLSLYF